LAVFFWALGPDSAVICQARYSFVVLGYTLILGAMFSKSWEINKVFTAGESGVVNPFQEVPWWQFCRVFFSIVSIQVLLLLIWLGVDGPVSVETIIDPVNFIAIHECSVMRPKVWLGLEIVYFSLLLIWGAYLAYETRDVWLKYNYPNESRSILLSIYNLAFCGIILVPLITTLDVSYETLFFLVSIAILWPTSFALFSVYMPKLAKFLGSSYRNSGNSQKGQMSGDKAERSHSIPSAVRAATEKDQEQKLLNANRAGKEHPEPESPVHPPTPGYAESPHKRSESPDSHVRHFKGTERTESTDELQTWRTLLTTSSNDDVHAAGENTV
jgi:gamma-aminobutyric acid type B receptor